MIEVFGSDIGGVIAEHVSFHPGEGDVPEVEGSFEALAKLRAEAFDDNMFLLSMCGPKMEAISRDWLQRHEFYNRTGIAEERVLYCRGHGDKAGIAEELGITHFVDDRMAVLSHFTRGEKLFLFRPREEEIKPFEQHLGRVTIVRAWPEITDKIVS